MVLLKELLLRGKVTGNEDVEARQVQLDDEEDNTEISIQDPQKHVKEALRALRKACQLKRESWRLWDNYLTVAASLSPPEYRDIITAQKNLIALLKDSKGETAETPGPIFLLCFPLWAYFQGPS